jgi:hypothetical protein
MGHSSTREATLLRHASRGQVVDVGGEVGAAKVDVFRCPGERPAAGAPGFLDTSVNHRDADYFPPARRTSTNVTLVASDNTNSVS